MHFLMLSYRTFHSKQREDAEFVLLFVGESGSGSVAERSKSPAGQSICATEGRGVQAERRYVCPGLQIGAVRLQQAEQSCGTSDAHKRAERGRDRAGLGDCTSATGSTGL